MTPHERATQERAAEIAAAKAVIESRIRLAQAGVKRNKSGRYPRLPTTGLRAPQERAAVQP